MYDETTMPTFENKNDLMNQMQKVKVYICC